MFYEKYERFRPRIMFRMSWSPSSNYGKNIKSSTSQNCDWAMFMFWVVKCFSLSSLPECRKVTALLICKLCWDQQQTSNNLSDITISALTTVQAEFAIRSCSFTFTTVKKLCCTHGRIKKASWGFEIYNFNMMVTKTNLGIGPNRSFNQRELKM